MIKVTYIDHMGSDLSVVNAARVSFGKTSKTMTDGDVKLIKYLAKHKHMGIDYTVVESLVKCAKHDYNYLLAKGVSPEQARMILPQNMMTEWYWSGSLDAFMDMCNLRCKLDTQYETRLVAEYILSEMINLFPVSVEALVR